MAVIGDIFEKIPTEVMVLNSEDKGPGEVSGGFLDYIVASFRNSIEASTGPSESGRGSRSGKSNWNHQMLASIMNSGDQASSPGIPLNSRKTPPVQKDLGMSGVWKVELRPTEVYNDVPSALHNVFQNQEASPTLLTIPAQSLCLQVKSGVLNFNNNSFKHTNNVNGSEINKNQGIDSNWRPIKLQSRIYLDRYLWESNDGLPMEWGFRHYAAQIKALEDRKGNLERYRVEMLFHEVSAKGNDSKGARECSR